jgi:hypothetical protein
VKKKSKLPALRSRSSSKSKSDLNPKTYSQTSFMVSGCFIERKPMDEKQIDKAIGYGLAIITGYYVVGIFIPILIWVEIGLVALRVHLTYQKHKR